MALLATLVAPAAAQSDRSAKIFNRYASQVVKIEVVEGGSGGKASLGTGFFVGSEGHLVTNYHVIAEVVHEPSRYRAQWIDPGGGARGATVVGIDVVADLAVLSIGQRRPTAFVLGQQSLPKGTRIYSLGHPQDLGLSIVEGTYNGLLEHALYPKIHFTGPLNPGMSGGPALTADGTVVGVNVATGGNSISFLVPAERVTAMLKKIRSEPMPSAETLLHEAGSQMLAHQERYLARLFQGDQAFVTLGPFELPTEPAAFFRCWGDAEREPDALFERVMHRCSTDDYVILTAGQSSGVITMEHELLMSRGLGPTRFYALYGSRFNAPDIDMSFEEFAPSESLTEPRCRAGNVRQGHTVMRTIFCVRGYIDFPDLYDATVKAAVLGARDVGLITTLTLSGVSFANAERIAREFLTRIRWRDQ